MPTGCLRRWKNGTWLAAAGPARSGRATASVSERDAVNVDAAVDRRREHYTDSRENAFRVISRQRL